MAKPIIKFKTYRQAARVGGKIYGVPNLGDPVVAEVTMQEVIDYAKLHNYSADTLSALLSQVIAGVGDLVARDGRPRMLSDLLKFEPVIKGTFDNMEQTVTNQKVLVRPRMLKEIKVALDPSSYSWQNQNDKDSPRLISVAPGSELYHEINLAAVAAMVVADTTFGLTYAGSRLCPNGWDPGCSFEIHLITPSSRVPGADVRDLRLDWNEEREAGFIRRVDGDKATDNAIVFGSRPTETPESEPYPNAWYVDSSSGAPQTYEITPKSGDQIVFKFTRTTGTGDTFTVEKSYTL